MKQNKKGLTLIEMLVVLGIIATIAGLLVPATQAVRRYAKNTQQRVQFSNISVALEAWKNDSQLGQYPASHADWTTAPDGKYSGAQNLATAMMGLDMRGYHPATNFQSRNATDVSRYYQSATYEPDAQNIQARREHYLDTTVARPVRLGNETNAPGLFADTGTLYRLSYVLSDVFDYKSLYMPLSVTGGGTTYTTVKVGSPILYFRANAQGTRLFPSATNYQDTSVFFQYEDNWEVVDLKHTDPGTTINLNLSHYDKDDHTPFYESIRNPASPEWMDGGVPQRQPYRKDTYLLISAGADGVYGTADDITNFGN